MTVPQSTLRLPPLLAGQSSALRRGFTMKTARRGAGKAIVGGLMVGGVVLVTALSLWATPYDPNITSLADRLQPGALWGGNPKYLLGTDQLGRDMLSRTMSGGQMSLTIAGLAVLGNAMIGTQLGLLGAYYKGIFDAALGVLAEIQLSLPSILIIILFLALLGPSVLTLAFVLAFDDWVGLFRLIRSRTIVESSREYTTAARVVGAKDGRIIFRHLLPNVLPTMLVLTTLSIGGVILAEAGLSYLGLGVSRPYPSWGRMISDGQPYMQTAWWVSALPAVMVALVVLGVNLLGDGLREMWKME
jgi:peptide/nickel transport system permease protein